MSYTLSIVETITILGVPVANISKEEALECFQNFIASGKTHQITTVNPEFLVISQKDAGFLRVLKTSDLNLADGVGLQLAALLNGKVFKQRISGREMVEDIAKLASKEGWKLFFLGSAPGIAKKAAEKLKRKYPNVKIKTSFVDPTAGGTSEAIRLIKKYKPDVLFVAYGAPTQDMWIASNKRELGVAVAMGVGGSFDYIAGKTKLPPAMISKIGLEWLWRLAHEPKRIKRQLRLPLFVFLVLLDWIRSK